MPLKLTEDEFIRFLAIPKHVSGPLKYLKKDRNHHRAQASVRCPEFPEINLRLVTQYHVFRNPRKFSISLLADNERVFSIDVNPGLTHYNKEYLEVVRGSHWQIYPNITTAIADNIERTHQQWMADFLRQANITLTGGYTAPAFEVENVQLNLLGGNI